MECTGMSVALTEYFDGARKIPLSYTTILCGFSIDPASPEIHRASRTPDHSSSNWHHKPDQPKQAGSQASSQIAMACSRISRLAYKPTPIPAAENVAKISDSRISR